MRKLTLLLLLLLSCVLSACGSAPQSVPTAKLHEVTAPAQGKVLGLIVEQGERISAGQPLFAIADPTLDTQVKELQTALAKAEAQLKRMEMGETTAAPAADTTAAQARVTAAQQQAARMNALYAQGAVARNKAQAAQAELAQAVAQLEAATKLVISTRPATAEEKTAQQQQILQLKTQLEEKLRLQQSNEALSPCTGMVSELKAQNNDSVEREQLVLIIKEESN